MATTSKSQAVAVTAPPAFDSREMSNASTRFDALSRRIREAQGVIKLLAHAAGDGLIGTEISEQDAQAGATAAARMLEQADAMLAVCRELYDESTD